MFFIYFNYFLKSVYSVYIYIYIHTHFSHLADTFIQSDLQMRTIETIKTNKRATTCKCNDKSGSTPMALFHCMVRHGMVHFWGVFHWVLYLVPGTFLVPPQPRFQEIRTVTKMWRVNSADHWLAGENRHYCVNELATWDPLDLNQHSQRRSGRTFLHQPQIICFIVCWGSTDVPLVDSRGADPVRAWWRDAEEKSLMYILLNLLYFQSMSSVYIFTSVSVFCFN